MGGEVVCVSVAYRNVRVGRVQITLDLELTNSGLWDIFLLSIIREIRRFSC